MSYFTRFIKTNKGSVFQKYASFFITSYRMKHI